MADINVRELERIIKELAQHVDQAQGFAIGVAAVVANLPGAEKVSVAQARRTASDIIGYGFGVGALSAPAGKIIAAICENAKRAASSRSD